MYKDFYQFKEFPFNITADPDFFFQSKHHDEAFSHLVYGIKQRSGIILMTGEIGTGKTTICRTLLNRLDKNVKTALILNPKFSEVQLLQVILRDLGISTSARDKVTLIDTLNHFLIQQTSTGNNVVIILDEAQNLGIKQLEQIRLLSNLETEKEKLLQIILTGQPELLEKLKLPELRQLNQRIFVRYHILPLNKIEVSDYINHRLKVAYNNIVLYEYAQFTSEAIDAVYHISQGTPRMINILCDRALLAGFVAGTYVIDQNIINNCAQEVVLQ